MQVSEEKKAEIRMHMQWVINSINNIETLVFEKDNPVFKGKKASQYVIKNLRTLIKDMSEITNTSTKEIT